MVILLLIFSLNLFASDKIEIPENFKIMSFNFPTTHQNKNIFEQIAITFDCLNNNDEKRMKSAKTIVKKYLPHIIGFQETHTDDLDALFHSKTIKKYYKSYAPRASTKDTDLNAIFYSHDTYMLLEKGNLFLNAEQKEGHNSWDDSHQRACTWIYLTHVSLPIKMYIYNTHLGLTNKSIIEGSKQIADHIMTKKKNDDYVFLIGDFNASVGELSYITKNPYNLFNIRSMTSDEHIVGPDYTYTGYDDSSKATPDHLFSSPQVKSLRFETITDSSHKIRPSDHYPIMATIQINKNTIS